MHENWAARGISKSSELPAKHEVEHARAAGGRHDPVEPQGRLVVRHALLYTKYIPIIYMYTS